MFPVDQKTLCDKILDQTVSQDTPDCISAHIRLTVSRPGKGGGGLFETAPTLKIRNYQTVNLKAMTTKFREFS